MKSLPWVIPVLFLVGVAVATLKLWPTMNPEIIMTAPLDPKCDLRQGPCQSLLPNGGTIEFDILPHSIPPLQPLELKVRLANLETRAVEVDFQGVDMNMGYNRVTLEEKTQGTFSGKGVLSVCVRNRMLWEARVLVHTRGGIISAPFRFETARN